MAEWTMALVTIHTVAGLNPDQKRLLSLWAGNCLER